MNREQAKEEIRHRAKEWLSPDKSGKGYVCPICGSGSGKSGTGITTKDGVHFTCWAGCFTNADVIDIIGQLRGATDYNDKLREAGAIFFVDIDGIESQAPPIGTAQTVRNRSDQRQNDTAQVDYTEFFNQAHQHINDTNYHRGISMETLDRYNVGYVQSWKHPKAPPYTPTSPRLIIPTSSESYLARDTRKKIPEEQAMYSKSKVGTVHVFNIGELDRATRPIFIVEGEIDALSIIDVGGAAVGLGSISTVRVFLKKLESKRINQPFIIFLDNDNNAKAKDNVAKAQEKLKAGLDKLNAPYIVHKFNLSYKDANDFLQVDREKFTVMIREAEEKAREVYAASLAADEADREAQIEKARKELQAEAAASYVQGFINSIIESKHNCYVPTGFKALDKILDGGLFAGLYIVGALSGLGKTTFCLQIADQIAQAGRDVLIFSLEMARNELIAKSVSRLTMIHAVEKYNDTKYAKTTRGILTGSRYEHYNGAEMELIQQAIEEYAEYSKHIFITEGVGTVGVDEIRARVERHVEVTGAAPVVLVDYLQILAPSDPRATDKQNTDRAVMELKRISRDFGTPVIGISSFNRENYYAPVALTSFKESGAIEYSSDALIGIQYEGMDYQQGEKPTTRAYRIGDLFRENEERAKAGQEQWLEIKVLKNRNGCRGKCLIDFYPKFNYYIESDDNDLPLTYADQSEDEDENELQEVTATYGE